MQRNIFGIRNCLIKGEKNVGTITLFIYVFDLIKQTILLDHEIRKLCAFFSLSITYIGRDFTKKNI